LGDWEYVQVWERLLLPVARAFQPDVVVISAGFDAALGDPLGGMVCFLCMKTSQCFAINSAVLLVALLLYFFQEVTPACSRIIHCCR
jgi:zinc transporter ZupT